MLVMTRIKLLYMTALLACACVPELEGARCRTTDDCPSGQKCDSDGARCRLNLKGSELTDGGSGGGAGGEGGGDGGAGGEGVADAGCARISDDAGNEVADCTDPRCAGHICRVDAGLCDIVSVCDEIGTACPQNQLLDAGIECRPSFGDCDLPDQCDGISPACQDLRRGPDFECLEAEGECDVAEFCDGGIHCPDNVFRPEGYLCAAFECENNIFTHFACNDSGQCDPTSVACEAPAECDAGSCDRSCNNDMDCPFGYCEADECRPIKNDGENCTRLEECSTKQCNTFFTDIDADGYGDLTLPEKFCGTSPPTGFSSNSLDCCDAHPEVKPGQDQWFDSTIVAIVGGGSCPAADALPYDWNCSMTEEREYETVNGCQSSMMCELNKKDCNGAGWLLGTQPACGSTATYVECGQEEISCAGGLLGKLNKCVNVFNQPNTMAKCH